VVAYPSEAQNHPSMLACAPRNNLVEIKQQCPTPEAASAASPALASPGPKRQHRLRARSLASSSRRRGSLHASRSVTGGRLPTACEKPEGRKIGIRQPISFDDIEQHQPPAGVQQLGGEANVSLFAVDDRGSRPTKDATNRRQSLPPATAVGPEAPQATATPEGCGPAFLGCGVSVVRWLAKLCAHCETRNRAALAPSRVTDLLAPARPADPDPAHGHREPT
jgi:hypothetical protein